MEKREILKETELFVLDMDGTFYLDTDVLDGALDFLEEVKKAGKRYVFFTNNSSKSPKTYIDKLAKMGCYIKRNQIITSGDLWTESRTPVLCIRYRSGSCPAARLYGWSASG